MSTKIHSTIAPLDQLTPNDEPRAGAKAYNCARLKQAGFRVPDAIVLMASISDDELAAISDHPWFNQFSADALFAVRSSGIGEDGSGQSFAGIHQTVLNVCRADLHQAVALCRESARSAQAIEYRRAKGISTDDIRIGVLIQQMIQPVVAGVAFTANPITGAANELVINSSWGVGEALVSGQVDPDEFVVRKDDGRLAWSRTGEKGSPERAGLLSLSPDQVRELAGILVAIERHYGTPQDIEWCHDGKEFWIVQSRPVTTRSSATNEVEWTRANLAEVLPDLTSPQALDAFEDLLNRAERQFLGKMMSPELGPMLKSFGGRLYFNLSQMRHLCVLTGAAPADMLRSVGHADAIQPSDETPSPLPGRKLLSAAPDILRMVWSHLTVGRIIRNHKLQTQRQLDRLKADPNRLNDDELWSALEDWFESGPAYMKTVLLLSGVMFHETPVRKLCDKVGFPFERLVYPQLGSGERSVSAQQAFDLMTLAQTGRQEPSIARYLSEETPSVSQMRIALRRTEFLAEFERFLEDYGHRGRYESDWSLPRYREDPTPLLRALQAHIKNGSEKSPSEIVLRQERESAEAWDAFTERLTPWQKRTSLPRVRSAIKKMKQYYLWREQVRSDLVRVMEGVRKWHLVLADRFVSRGWLDSRDDYFLIHLSEISAVITGLAAPETLRTLAAERIMQLERHRSLQMPLLMHESELASLIRSAGVSSRSDDESQLTGHPVSGGCVEAEVVVIRDPGDFGRMKSGAILVAPATDPSWTPLFTLAAGVIVEVGGVLSHASTIAREYGLPAIANVKHATKRLKTGERVRLDANNGTISRL